MKRIRNAVRRSSILLFAIVAMLASGQAGAGPAVTFNPQLADTLRVAWSRIGPTDNVDPQTARSVTNWRLVMEAYETLTYYPDPTGEPQPFLAESWRRLEGGRVWEFKLKRGIRFSTGNEMTAEAVKYSIDRAMRIGIGSIFPLEGIYDRTEVVDRYTVRFHLESSTLAWPAILANPVILGIIDPDYVEKNGGIQIGRANPVVSRTSAGTGPWVVEEIRPNERIQYRRNPNYWRGWQAPYLERVAIQIVPEESTRLLLLERGDVDIAEVSGLSLPELKNRIRANSLPIRVIENDARGRPLPSLGLFWVNLNHGVLPTSDINVRRGLRHSFNYEQFLSRVMNGYGVRMRGLVPSAAPCADKTYQLPQFDLVRAKRFFDEASPAAQQVLRQGFVFRFQTNYVLQREGALMWQADLARVGVNVRLEEVDASTWLQTTRTRPGQPLSEARWTGSYPDPEYFMHPIRTGYWPPTGFGSAYAGGPEIDGLIQAARTAGTWERRCEFYKRLSNWLNEDATFVEVSELHGGIHPFNVQANWVRGFVHNPATTSPSVFYPMFKRQ